ncbi:meiotically up-regulated 190 protein [Moniliophthora roreri MCA 2997]|uniref:Meiotically up-regulated 190 protein n=1 Tax=Moniliophthora roreri (strain MCA 2997) TaxID=1381753 RepID=V2XQ86_MONRO|nr:meiotically up-regulated 190 protein [Moniliophthora roreri MCA 2997]
MSSQPSPPPPDKANNSKQNEREVTDPVTHLPIKIHDTTSVELEQIPPPSSSEVKAAEDKQEDTQKHHDGMEDVVKEEMSKGWWEDVNTERRKRTQAAVIAAVGAAVGGTLSLSLSRLLGSLFGVTGGFIWTDLLIGSVGSFALALGIGGTVFYWGQYEKTKDKLVPRKKEQTVEKQWSRNPAQKHPETASWLNSFLDALWPIVNPSLFTALADMLEDALQASLPKFINGVRVADIGQGAESVRILGVRWLDGGDANEERDGMEAEEGDFVNLEVAIAYRARAQSKNAGLRGRSGNMHLLMQFWLSGGVVLPVWAEVTGLLTTARLRLQLTPNPPFLSVMTLTLLGQPKVSLTATPLAKNFMNVMDIPGLSNWLQRSIDEAVAQYVAPRSLTMDLKTILMGREKMDTESAGIIVVTIKSAQGFKEGDSSKMWKSSEGRTGDPYVAVGWAKWGKPLWFTRILQNESNPVWEETCFMLVGPAELNAQERLRLQLWDSDRFTADDLLGTVEVPLKDVMQSSETKNRISDREDEFTGDDETSWPGQLRWSLGYFSKTTLEQHLSNREENAEEIKHKIVEEAEDKLREAEGRNHEENSEIEQQKREDLKERSDEIIASSPPPQEWPSGILSVRIEQINGVEVPQVRQSGTNKDIEEEDSDDLPSPYCTVIINHEMVYRTRTKTKANNPYFDAGTEKFIKDWRNNIVMIAVRDSRLHEADPLIGVVVIPLYKILKNRSQLTDSFPLAGGVGFGRMKCSLLFRSVQAKLPRQLLGWETGTLEIYPESIRAVPGLPAELSSCRILLRTLYGKGKVYPKQEDGGNAEWHQKRDKPIRLPVKKRYSSCLLVQFRKRVLGPDQTPVFGTIWLRAVPDEEVVTIKMALRKNKGNVMERSRFNATEDIGEKIGDLEMKIKVWPGLSGYHHHLADKDLSMADVMEVLDGAEEQSGETLGDDEGLDESDSDSDDSSSSSSSSSSSEDEVSGKNGGKEGIGGRLRGVKTGLKDYNNRRGELHRRHRGLMQWSMARKVAWIGREAEDKANEVTQGFRKRFKHQQMDGGVEKEA